MSSADKIVANSPEGIAFLMRWARAHGFVLSAEHARIARRHGVSTEGVLFARPIPPCRV